MIFYSCSGVLIQHRLPLPSVFLIGITNGVVILLTADAVITSSTVGVARNGPD